jgi:hypothetical protein
MDRLDKEKRSQRERRPVESPLKNQEKIFNNFILTQKSGLAKLKEKKSPA